MLGAIVSPEVSRSGPWWWGKCLGAFLLVALLCPATLLGQTRPEAGPVVPELAAFDNAMRSVMAQHNIGAGVAGIMRDGKLVYRRAFGWDDAARTVPIEEDVIMRLASVTKPLTAATIRNLISDGHIDLNQRVFSLDEPGSGILDHQPFGSSFDPRLKDITVNHLLQHRGGWDRDAVGDWTYYERTIASDMGLPNPPGRDATLSWILGNNQGLQFDPGSGSAYSNIGYMVLGMIVEEVTGQPHLEVMHEEVFRPMAIRDDMVLHGRTFAADQDPREPHYDSSTTAFNVFRNPGDGQPLLVNRPYGGWDHEARIGQGAIVADPIAILQYMQEYVIAGNNIGAARGSGSASHSGSFAGTNTIAVQRSDGTDYVIFFNKSDTVGDASALFANIINSGTINWPTIDIREYEIELPGDLNGDGQLGQQDIDKFIGKWRSTTGDLYFSDRYYEGDLNFDGVVDLRDAGLLRNAFTTAGLQFALPASIYQTVPEASSLALAGMLLGVAGVVYFRSRRSRTQPSDLNG